MKLRTPLLTLSLFVLPLSAPGADRRDFLLSGSPLPHEGYCDQPYVVETKDGNWLCVLTTGRGAEGGPEQHVVSTISRDRGKTWSALTDIEPAGGPQASWVTPLLTPDGRVYVFYNYNGDHISDPDRKLKPTGRPLRTDVMGWFVYKFSDDHGHTWSKDRYRIPLRTAALDRETPWKGKVQSFWSIDKPSIVGRDVVIAFTRMGTYQKNRTEEGWVLRSDNVLAENDPAKIRWRLLPEGDRGIWSATLGPAQQEHNIVPLSNGDLYLMLRTSTGHPAMTISRDGGLVWAEPAPATFTPGGRKIKTPVACPQLWKTKGGRYLFWFHHNSYLERGSAAAVGSRNLAWIAGGVERDGQIQWSQPELVAYFSGANHYRGFSYPDLVESDGEYFIAATCKEEARFQHLEKALIDGLWRQDAINTAVGDGLLLSWRSRLAAGQTAMPRLPNPVTGGSFAIELWFRPADLGPGSVLLDSREEGRGLVVTTGERAALQLTISDGTTTVSAETDSGLLRPGTLHHVVFNVDGGPKLISSVVDGQVCDGGDERPFGWSRFYPPQDKHRNSKGPDVGDVTGGAHLKLPASGRGLEGLRIYGRYLRTTEAIGNGRAGVTSISPTS